MVANYLVRWPIWVGLTTIKGTMQDDVHQFWRNYREK